MTERVLCFAAHPDDETLGCGATLARHAREGDETAVVVFADGVASRAGGGGLVPAGFQAAIRERHGALRAACKILGTENVYIHQFADNRMDNVALLDVVQYVERHLERFKPTVVYTHWNGDLNVDHRVVHEAVNVACRSQPGCTVKRLIYFEVPCSTAWGEGFEPNYCVDVSRDFPKKLEAARCYTTELRAFPHPRSLENIEAVAKVRGAKFGIELAEAFVVGRFAE